jgi:hypothetical protein
VSARSTNVDSASLSPPKNRDLAEKTTSPAMQPPAGFSGTFTEMGGDGPSSVVVVVGSHAAGHRRRDDALARISSSDVQSATRQSFEPRP